MNQAYTMQGHPRELEGGQDTRFHVTDWDGSPLHSQWRAKQDLNKDYMIGAQDPKHVHKAGHPSLYGGAGDWIIKPPTFGWRRRRLNIVAIFISLFVPWLLFCFMFWLTSFNLFYRHPAICLMIASLAFVFVMVLGAKANESVKKFRADRKHDPTWYVFLVVTSLIAWGLGMYVGYHNFYYRMEAYYGLQNLGSYSSVDPDKQHGQQLMDAGRVVFQNGTRLDLSKAISFRNNDLYCAAPIVGPNSNNHPPDYSYDFWAVGINCCCGDTVRQAHFQCGEYANSQASSGLRLMMDEQRPFFRLAVQQAVGAHGLRATHPLFFHWVQDPISATEAYRWDGHRHYLMGVYLHFAFQLFLVLVTTAIFSRIDDSH
jgi:hypothetical protein